MSTLSVKAVPVSEQQHHPEAFPLVYLLDTPGATMDDVTAWLGDAADGFVARLAEHGAILFRGFPVRDANDFDAFIRAFKLDSFTYEESLSNAVRVNKTELVFTANEAPANVSIFLHHEMAQTPLFPSRLFFCCEQAPESAGQTPLCRSDVLLAELTKKDPAFVAACAERGVRYSNVMPDSDDAASGQGRSWKKTLGVADKVEAEAKLNKLGYRWEWRDDGSLRATTPALPAIRKLADGRRVFFNQLIAAFRGWEDARNDPRKSICFGDDSEIPSASMLLAIDLSDALTFDLAWQNGDVALVDNFLVMHGRRPFSGQRRVLASLVADDGSRLLA